MTTFGIRFLTVSVRNATMFESNNCSSDAGRRMKVEEVVLLFFGVWLTGLSVVFYLLLAHYRRLAKGSSKENLEKILGKILDIQEFSSGEIKKIWDNLARIEKADTFHVQRIGLVKFNPFGETGGAQSFSLAILDGGGSGLVITGLHGRDRTRLYVKPIKSGKSSLELSAEEKKAIIEAGK